MMIYPLLAALAVLQLLNPNSIERIASQTVGRWLFGLLAGLLLVAAGCALASSFVSYPDRGLDPSGVPVLGFSDALLHASLAVVYIDLAVGEYLLTASARALIIGGLGLLLFGTGCYLGARALRPLRPRGRDVIERDRIVRTLVFVVIGGLLFSAAVLSSADQLAKLSSMPVPLLVIVAALSAYGFHTLWISGKASELPAA